MDILQLSIKNFLTIGTGRVKLGSKGLVLVQGENEDDPSANSNGAGKSSIPDALCWALYGETARGVKGDAIVNKKMKKDCYVGVNIKGDDGVYFIERYRKDKVEKNRLRFSTFDVKGDPVDLTLGTDKLTQAAINKYIGCSLEVFRASIYAGQDIMPDLPGMTDKQLKVLVEEAAGIDRLQIAYEIARKRMGVAEKELSTAEGLLDKHTDEKIRLDGEFIDLQEKKEDWDKSQKIKIEGITDLTKTLIADIKSKGEPIDTSTPTLEIEGLDEKLEGRADEEAELEELNERVRSVETEIAMIDADIATTTKLAKDKKTELDGVDDSIGEPCPECGKPYEESDLAELKTLKKENIASFLDRIKDLKLQHGTRSKLLKAASKAAADFKASMTDVSKVVVAQKLLRDKIDAANEANQELIDLKSEAKRKIDKAKEWKAEVNPYSEMLEDIEAKQINIAKKEEVQEEIVEDLEKDFNLSKEAVDVFGPAGVRAHILDTVTPYLNDRTAHYLGSLSDGNIEATWSTLAKTAKGELREKFNIKVKNEKGAESFMGLSGGEKRKVRLATSMALQDMVASRASKPINLFIADEVDHALDENGLERLMGILDEKARERGTVLVISHNSLSDWIRQQVTVTKKGGLSHISGVLA